MTAPSWPSADLPVPQIAPFAMGHLDPRTGRSIEKGPPSYQAHISGVTRRLNLSLTVTAEKILILRDFYQRVLANGTLAFWMADPILDAAGLSEEDGPIVTSGGAEIIITVNCLHKFGEGGLGDVVAQGKLYRQSFQLWQMP